MTDTTQRPCLILEATYTEGAKNNMDVRIIDTNIAKDGILYHQMYDHLYEGAKRILENTKKGRLELKLTFFE